MTQNRGKGHAVATREISGIPENMLDPQKGLCCVELHVVSRFLSSLEVQGRNVKS